MLPRTDAHKIDRLIVGLRKELPECDFSYVNIESTL